MARLAFLVCGILGVTACTGPVGPEDGCGSDADCKGARTCQAGTCVDPAGTSSSSSGGSAGTSGSGGGQTQRLLTSGSRLKVKRLVGEDGSTKQIGFHDTVLDIDCEFSRAESGGFLCVPTTYPSLLEQSAQNIYGQYYADADCSQPLATSDLPRAQLKYFLEGSVLGFGPTISVVRRATVPGDEHLGSIYFKQSPTTGTCNPSTRSETHYYRLGDETPLSTFAAAAASLEP